MYGAPYIFYFVHPIVKTVEMMVQRVNFERNLENIRPATVGQPFTKKWFFRRISLDPGQNARGSRGRSGASWRHLEAPYTPEKIKLTKIIYGLPLLLLKTFCATHPTRGSLSKIQTDQYYSP